MKPTTASLILDILGEAEEAAAERRDNAYRAARLTAPQDAASNAPEVVRAERRRVKLAAAEADFRAHVGLDPLATPEGVDRQVATETLLGILEPLLAKVRDYGANTADLEERTMAIALVTAGYRALEVLAPEAMAAAMAARRPALEEHHAAEVSP